MSGVEVGGELSRGVGRGKMMNINAVTDRKAQK
ncbi:uncharacterized protein G2W53_024568 [Senna tora]|uniref:Uncharacterized protein n=1 Tax=Senna tora TaxID=362788 RepID=A0A834TBT3_9FABA|nr:uncharacterized protein G2W53_024568 [Senna tora]